MAHTLRCQRTALPAVARNEGLEGSAVKGEGTHRASDRGQTNPNLRLVGSSTIRAGSG